MSKNKKNTEYLPLHWCKKLDFECKATIGDISCEDMECLLSISFDKESMDKKQNVIMKYPILTEILNFMVKNHNEKETVAEFFSDMDSMYNIKKWGENKQVFKFDEDFLEELVRTENLYMTKDIFDYLPFKHFYIDISDDKKLCEEILCQGMFIYVSKDETMFENNYESDYIWRVHVCKVNEKLFFNDIFSFENKNGERNISNIEETTDVKIQTFDEQTGNVSVKKQQVHNRKYENIVFQILTYLSSTDSDIEESESSKQLYRKPNPSFKPKHKYSEIQSYDVGYRFGSSFRKWKKSSKESSKENNARQGFSRQKKRPHARRAHWSHYWYGKKDSDERVCRAKWIAETFIGLKSNENEAVIHNVKNKL